MTNLLRDKKGALAIEYLSVYIGLLFSRFDTTCQTGENSQRYCIFWTIDLARQIPVNFEIPSKRGKYE